MSGAATQHAHTGVTNHSVSSRQPFVFIDGQPRVDLWVRRLTMDGVLDVRTAELVPQRIGTGHEQTQRALLEKLEGRRVRIAQPIALAGDSTTWMPLLQGIVRQASQQLSGDDDELSIIVVDDWQQTLDHRIAPEHLDAFAAGSWTLEAFVGHLGTLGGLTFSTTGLDAMQLQERVTPPSPSNATFGRLLEDLLVEHDLLIQRQMQWEGSRIIEHRVLRPGANGRAVELAINELVNPDGAVEALNSRWPVVHPTKHIAEAAGQVVESTFVLHPGWNPADESLADSEYARSTSSDFDAVASVFRLWLLNEDGASADHPVFDLTTFFDEGHAIEPQPLRFGNALTQDSAGRSVGVVIEMSVDAGDTWTRYPGVAIVLTDRAGVSLDDDALPTGWIDAVRGGDGRIRVTAALRSPLPLRQIRWRGNPFFGSFDPVRYNLSDRFTYQRLDAASKFAGDVASGLRTAAVRDDRSDMMTWLSKQAASVAQTNGSARVQVIGPMLSLRLGDRLDRFAGQNITPTWADPASSAPQATLTKIEHRWDRAQSMLTWNVR